MTDMRSIKEMIKCATLGIPKGMKKCNFYFYSRALVLNEELLEISYNELEIYQC